MRKSIAIATALLLCGTSAQAATILGLCNTGKNAACTGSGTLGTPDANWTLTDPNAVAFNGTPINDAWLPNNATSFWATPAANGNQTFDPTVAGIYNYTQTFDLTGFNPATGSFNGRFAVDNAVDSITLNGNTITGSGGTFNAWTAFSANSGFVNGENTLTFRVRNVAQRTGNPTGLRVEFLGSQIAAVPEPSTWAMMLLGFGFIGGAMRSAKRRQKFTVSYA